MLCRYTADTLGLAAFSIIGAQHGIRLGLHPLICCCGGVIIVFGGVIRDLLCDRTLALGGPDPYASVTLAGASVYVMSRQLYLSGILGTRIPLAVRIVAPPVYSYHYTCVLQTMNFHN